MPARSIHVAVACAAALLATAPAAQAAFPGQNGSLTIGNISEDRPSSSTDFAIETVAPNGSGRRTLLSCRSVDGDCPGTAAGRFPGLYDPVASPDGQRLAIGLGDSIGITAADGSGLRELVGLPPGAREPAWSPDGSELVFVADSIDTGQSDLYVVAAEGGVARPLTLTPGVAERQPTWGTRPLGDGGRIAYVRGSDVWTMHPDGERVRRLTGKGGTEPSFSPHASKLAFVRRKQLYTVGAGGGGLDRVTNLGAFSPTWSPDGKRIAFIRRGDGPARPGIYRLGPKGGALTRVANAIFDSSCECTFERSLDWAPRR